MKADTIHDLKLLRDEIDQIDAELLNIIARRFRVVRQVIYTKKSLGLSATIPARVDEVINNAKSMATELGLPSDSIEKLWRVLVAETIRFEESCGVEK